MPLRLYKTEEDNKLVIERAFYAKRFVLTIDREKCKGCDICKEICHMEAIELRPSPKKNGEEKANPPVVDVDPQKCDYCGMCDVMCPFGAVRITINGEHVIPVVEKESFPQLIREIEVDMGKCKTGCIECAVACPLKIIKVCPVTPLVEVEKDLCPCCKRCEVACPEGAIRVRKIFNGSIRIYHEKCPKDCRDCLDVCPVNAMYLGENGKVHVDEQYCIYCGACVYVCPEEGALEIRRTSIYHTPVKSGAWNKALEKLTSTVGMGRELRAKGLAKAIEAIKNRVP